MRLASAGLGAGIGSAVATGGAAARDAARLTIMDEQWHAPDMFEHAHPAADGTVDHQAFATDEPAPASGGDAPAPDGAAPTVDRAALTVDSAAPTVDGAAPTVDDVTDALSNVIDPELGLDFVELGLIYGVEVQDGDVHVTFTLTTPGCPIGPHVTEQIEEFVGELDGVRNVTSEMVFTPPWSPERMSEDAKFALGF